MSENSQNSHSFRNSEAAKRLADDLANLDFDLTALSESKGAEEMLSLIVQEANNGIDISERYPNFYRKLLNHPILMQAFLDVLESIEDEEENRPIPWTVTSDFKPAFLADSSPKPVIARLADNWSIRWQRTVDQLQAIFSPKEFAYRSDPTISEDLWFIVLRDEVEIDGSLYTVVLECTFSEDDEEAIAPFLNIAVTVGSASEKSRFPIQSSLQWGTYKETIQITEGGRARFPDIPLPAMFDKEYEKVNAELGLTIEPMS